MSLNRETLHSSCPTLPPAQLSEENIRLLNLYLKELAIWNSYINLMGRPQWEVQDGAEQHIYEALNGYSYLANIKGDRNRLQVADLGSGNGIPGVPLAIIDPTLSMTLVELSAKRCAFLQNIQALIAPRSLHIIQGDWRQIRRLFDCLIFRALTPLNERVVQYLVELVAPGGALIAYKGEKKQATQEAAYLRSYFTCVEIHSLLTPRRSTMVIAHDL